MSTSRLYFAYGSNLNSADLRRWLDRNPAAELELVPVGTGYLPDMELVFDYHSASRRGGALDLRPRLGQAVPGVLCEVRGGGWSALDWKEGAPGCYERQRVSVLTLDGRCVEATTYLVCEARREARFVRPTRAYVEVVRAGLKQHDLPTTMLEAAARGEESPWLVDTLFAYGTLMRGESRSIMRLASGPPPVYALLATAPGRLLDLGDYPAMVLPQDHECVQGELFRFDDIGGVLGLCDEIEGFCGYAAEGSLYRRALLEVDVGDGRIREAWTYLLAQWPEGAAGIGSGDWREHRGQRKPFLEALVRAHWDGPEEEVVRQLMSRVPFSMARDPDERARGLVPLAGALERGELSERRLAQISGRWAVCP
jgi:gamma-glutamylcyclotransferase (GGCT)/AIG2-like uncharacterized protein YtfP